MPFSNCLADASCCNNLHKFEANLQKVPVCPNLILKGFGKMPRRLPQLGIDEQGFDIFEKGRGGSFSSENWFRLDKETLANASNTCDDWTNLSL